MQPAFRRPMPSYRQAKVQDIVNIMPRIHICDYYFSFFKYCALQYICVCTEICLTHTDWLITLEAKVPDALINVYRSVLIVSLERLGWKQRDRDAEGNSFLFGFRASYKNYQRTYNILKRNYK
uniref:Uncharacterized protein n=1 Tax=Glossina pallidipes TaxID=7398 RepID=A0A1A9ZNS0_GLOPL